jgi:hypothetical protein
MLTYLLQDRVLRGDKMSKLTFPNRLHVKVKLAPPQQFGASNGYSRLYVHGRKVEFLWDANTGRFGFQSDPPLEPLGVAVNSPSTQFSLIGDVINYDRPCATMDDLLACLSGFQYVLPALLNLKFPDPPVVEFVQGTLGNVEFRWEHQEGYHHFRPLSVDALEQHVADSLNWFPLFSENAKRRLLAAIIYFYVASRLLVAGHSQWEFMAESVLNLNKALEILFGESRDLIRNGLSKLNYTEDEIEGDFIPLTILRDLLDVAHPRSARFKQDDLRIVYQFVASCEERFRDLLQRAIDGISNHSFNLPNDESLESDAQNEKRLTRLIESLTQRNNKAEQPQEGMPANGDS